jgi:hypothetical protein
MGCRKLRQIKCPASPMCLPGKLPHPLPEHPSAIGRGKGLSPYKTDDEAGYQFGAHAFASQTRRTSMATSASWRRIFLESIGSIDPQELEH